MTHGSAPLCIDIGGGNRPGRNGWTTIDIADQCDLYWDLRDGIPFPDNSVAKVYSSHLFEHLTFDQGQELMRECLRVLKPGGSFSICVPNAGMYISAYAENQNLPEEYFAWEPAYHHTTRIDMINYVAYMAGEHKYMFDQENLEAVLRLAGLERVSGREFDPETDFEERHFESIYAIGYKP